jgi:hypothetical protein
MRRDYVTSRERVDENGRADGRAVGRAVTRTAWPGRLGVLVMPQWRRPP